MSPDPSRSHDLEPAAECARRPRRLRILVTANDPQADAAALDRILGRSVLDALEQLDRALLALVDDQVAEDDGLSDPDLDGSRRRRLVLAVEAAEARAAGRVLERRKDLLDAASRSGS